VGTTEPADDDGCWPIGFDFCKSFKWTTVDKKEREKNKVVIEKYGFFEN
jgi:hypothetical protein